MPSSKQIADTVGVLKTKYHRIRKENQVKRDLLEVRSESVAPNTTIFSQVVKSSGWTKVDKELEEKVRSFIVNHPNIVQSNKC